MSVCMYTQTHTIRMAIYRRHHRHLEGLYVSIYRHYTRLCIPLSIYTQTSWMCIYRHHHRHLEGLYVSIYIDIRHVYVYVCLYKHRRLECLYIHVNTYVCLYIQYVTDIANVYIYSLLHLVCHFISFSNLTLNGLIPTEHDKRDGKT